MRGILMVLLGGGLLWLVLDNFGAGTMREGGLEREVFEDASAAEVGQLMQRPAETHESAPAAAPAEPVAAAPVSASEPPLTAPHDRTARSAALPRGDEVGTRSAGWTAEDEAGALAVLSGGPEDSLAALLLHDRRRLPAFLENEGKGLPPERRDLALALALAIEGRGEVAQRYAEKLGQSTAVSAKERELLGAAIAGKPIPASWTRGSALVHAGAVALRAEEGERALAAARWKEAVQAFSDVLLAEVQAPWAPNRESLREWSEKLERAQSRHRWSRQGTWPAVEVEVQPGDSLTVIRQRVLRAHPDMVFCTGLIDRANELGGRYLRVGETLRVPKDRVRVDVFLRAHWLLVLIGDEVVAGYEVGIGKPGHETTPGSYVAGLKQKEPTWFPPGEPPVPFGDPENALGTRWIAWHHTDGSSTDGLGIHGTNDPAGVGGDVSRGCIRMHNAHVEELFEVLPLGGRIEVHP